MVIMITQIFIITNLFLTLITTYFKNIENSNLFFTNATKTLFIDIPSKILNVINMLMLFIASGFIDQERWNFSFKDSIRPITDPIRYIINIPKSVKKLFEKKEKDIEIEMEDIDISKFTQDAIQA